jgi:hypothetical protein
LTQGEKLEYIKGFDKGPSYTSVVPLEKATFINFDEDSYIDDYSYLASIPTSVFKDQEENRLFSHPLLFYNEEDDYDEEKFITLNDYKGIDYFMEDWMGYCNGRMDKMNLINLEEKDLDSDWKAQDITEIHGGDIYEIANKIALNEWSYNDKAVVAVVDEDHKELDEEFENKKEGIIPKCEVKYKPLSDLVQTNSLNPVYQEFEVDDIYKYIYAETWWDCLILGPGLMIPTGDPDIQLYYKDEDWIQASVAAFWNVYMPPGHEFTSSHVYKPGKWQIGITDFPTEGESDAPRRNEGPIQGSLLKALFGRQVTYHVDITMYPGVDVEIPEKPPFGCRDVFFKLSWDNDNVDLGFSVIGPSGENILTVTEEDDNEEPKKGEKRININQLGECIGNEHYSVSVFALNDVSGPLEFELEYGWSQKKSKVESNSLTSATEGAVLASGLNAPLLYTSTKNLDQKTEEVLYKLGVDEIYLVNIGDKLDENVKNKISSIAKIKSNYVNLHDIYDDIREISESTDIVFSTIDPWTEWYLAELKPGNETEAGLFIGPAAYIAAHHGTPVVLIDNHPRLSSAVVWHNEFWKRNADDRYFNTPSVAEMVLTGRRIWDFLEDYDFDKVGKESIITVADQYDIGTSWDRIFPGVGIPGRICGSPVDTSVWISRSMFYPALIFENPGLNPNGIELINGSLSKRTPILQRLKITRQSGTEKFTFPVLGSFISVGHRFNERASKYYGAVYTCADGLTPGVSPIMDSPIDEGSIEKYTGKTGSYFPDMSAIDVEPFYYKKGGYEFVFSTQLSAVAENLNKGVILWTHSSHGTEPRGGGTLFWDPEKGFEEQKAKGGLNRIVATIGKIFSRNLFKDENPAWGYEWILGSTEEPDSMAMDVDGRLPFTSLKIPIPALGQDWVVSVRPLRELLNKIFFWSGDERPFKVDTTYDGQTATSGFSRFQTAKFVATDIEKELDNVHSLGFITNICQTSNTYLHSMMIRHGSVFQVQDPWPTSWYGTVWKQSIPRDIVLGNTVGEAYEKGISHVGILYLGGAKDGGPQWWWDIMENVVYFGDPDLRVYVPDTEYSSKNYWERDDVKPLSYDSELDINGHMPFGATNYPNKKEPQSILMIALIIIIAIIILLIIFAVIFKKKK